MAFETLSIPVSLRFQIIEPKEEVEKVLFVLHGYGQLIEYFSQKLADLNLSNTLLVFPEGRHRFYLKGHSGRVGASWMTREWREEDIQTNNRALDLLLNEITNRYPMIESIAVLGFSQGGATAARWVSTERFTCDHFISWASVYPPDLDMHDFSQSAKKNTFVVGLKDEFFTDENRKQLIQEYAKLGIETCIFDGTHDIDTNTLKHIL